MSEDTKFKKFLATKKLDVRRVLMASYKLERLTPEDRSIKAAKSKPAGDGENATKETRKPHSGRPITQRAIQAALDKLRPEVTKMRDRSAKRGHP